MTALLFLFFSLFLLSLFLLSTLPTTLAAKDDAYYPAGITNPNVSQNEMYWKEPFNVLQDLSQFSALYIQYHGCV